MPIKTDRTTWVCVKCGRSGSVSYATDAGITEVVQLIEDDHKSESKDCPIDLVQILIEKEASRAADHRH